MSSDRSRTPSPDGRGGQRQQSEIQAGQRQSHESGIWGKATTAEQRLAKYTRNLRTVTPDSAGHPSASTRRIEQGIDNILVASDIQDMDRHLSGTDKRQEEIQDIKQEFRDTQQMIRKWKEGISTDQPQVGDRGRNFDSSDSDNGSNTMEGETSLPGTKPTEIESNKSRDTKELNARWKDDLERHETVEDQYKEYRKIEEFFPDDLKKYEELLSTCEKQHNAVMELTNTSPLPIKENRISQELYDAHVKAHLDYGQAISKAEMLSRSIAVRINELPKEVKNYLTLHQTIQESLLNVQEQERRALEDIGISNSPEQRREIIYAFKNNIQSSLSDSTEQWTTPLEETAQFLHKDLRHPIHNEVKSYLEDLQEWPQSIEDGINEDTEVFENKARTRRLILSPLSLRTSSIQGYTLNNALASLETVNDKLRKILNPPVQ